jgi:formylglycine-generating enzyme required for sulfatase activity
MKRYINFGLFAGLCLAIASCGTVKDSGLAGKKQGAPALSSDNTILVKGNETIADFYLGKFEVTQADYEKVMGNNPSHFIGQKLPVENLTWIQALEYCNQLSKQEGYSLYYDLTSNPVSIDQNSTGYRLPTREEWRYAASGGNQSGGFVYSGSNNNNEVAWFKSNGEKKTHIVGSKKSNELGFFDMSGNVYEWTFGTGKNIPILGGCFGDVEEYLRTDNSNFSSPAEKSQYIGFRIARSAK